jgi:hypothetical protein
MTNLVDQREIALRNLIRYCENQRNVIGNLQLMLFLGIELDDTNIVTRALDLGAPVNETISNRNYEIMRRMGCNFSEDNDRLNEPVSPNNIQITPED